MDRAAALNPTLVPSVARIYDYFLGGHHNFQVDRDAAEQIVAIYPDLPFVLRVNRAFLRRAVNYLTQQGVGQFLDLGSGIPTAGNVHEVVQHMNPNGRVVYVDNDPVAVTHSASILRSTPLATVIQADARYPADILGHPKVRALIDCQQPMAVLLVAFLHFVTDDALALEIVGALREAVAPGSYIAISHMTPVETAAAPDQARAAELYSQTTAPLRPRTLAEVAQFFAGLELVEPGLVYLPLWHPEGPDDLFLDEPQRSAGLGGIGRKP